MHSTTEKSATKSWPPFIPVLIRLFRVLVILVVVLFVGYHIADQILWRQLQQQREVFRARFGAVDFRDFVPKPVEPARDAGRIYGYATHLIDKANEAHGDWSVYEALVMGPSMFDKRGSRDDATLPTAEELDVKVQEKMAALAPAFAVLREAEGLEQGVLMHFSELGKRPAELEHMRDIAHCLAAKAIVEARAGRMESASAWLEAGNKFVALLGKHPTLAVHMIRVGLVKVNFGALQHVLNATSSMPDLGPAYLETLDRIADPATFTRHMVSEAWNGWPAGESHSTRLQYTMQLLKMGELTDRILVTLKDSPTTNVAADLQKIEHEAIDLNFVLYYYPPILIPAYVRAVESYFDIPICRDLSTIALSLRAYKIAQGSYPDDLEELVPRHVASLPVDPYLGVPYRYERIGDGFRLWRAGAPPRSREREIHILQ